MPLNLASIGITVAGGAAVAAGIATAQPWLVALGATAVAGGLQSALAPAPADPAIDGMQQIRQISDAEATRSLTYGLCVVGSSVTFVGKGGSRDEQLWWDTIICDHDFHIIRGVQFNDDWLPIVTGDPTGEEGIRLNTDPRRDGNFPVNWYTVTLSSIYRTEDQTKRNDPDDITHLAFRFRFGNTVSMESHVSAGAGAAYTARNRVYRGLTIAHCWQRAHSTLSTTDLGVVQFYGHWKNNLYDPRLNSGAGGTAWTSNAVLVWMDFLKERLALTNSHFDLANIAAEAEVCDDTSWLGAAGAAQYEINGQVQDDAETHAVALLMAQHFVGGWAKRGDQYRAWTGSVRSVVATLTPADFAGPGYQDGPSEESWFNTYTAHFVPPTGSDGKLIGRMVPHPGAADITKQTYLDQDGGQALRRDLKLDYCRTARVAEHTAWIALQELRQFRGTIYTRVLKAGAGELLEIGDVVKIIDPDHWDGPEVDGGRLQRLVSKEEDFATGKFTCTFRGYADGNYDVESEPTSEVIGAPVKVPPGPDTGQVSAEDIGLAGDGVTDDSVRLNIAIEDLSAGGGGYIFLKPPREVGFYLANAVRNLSNVTLDWAGSRIFLGKVGRLRNQGQFAEDPDPDENKWRLESNLSVGATTLTFASGFAPASLNTADVVLIRGLSDSSRNALQREELRVSSYDSGTRVLTFTPALAEAYQVEYVNPSYENAEWNVNNTPDRTLLSKIVDVQLRSDANTGDFTVDVLNAVTLFEVGDYVILIDNLLAADIAGASQNPVNQEPNQILEILGTAGSYQVRLAYPVERFMDMTYEARLSKLAATRNAHQMNAIIYFTDVPDPAPASRIPPCENAYAIDSSFERMIIPNDAVMIGSPGAPSGTRGNGFRNFRSLRSGYRNCTISNAHYTASGDGYGLSNYYSRSCYHHDCRTSGMRHGWIGQGCTDAMLTGYQSVGDLLSGVDIHGVNEIGTHVEAIITAPTSSASDQNTMTGLAIGNTFHGAGAHRSNIRATIRGFRRPLQWGCGVRAPSSGNFLDLRIEGCRVGFRITEFAPDNTVVALDNVLHVTFKDISERCIQVDGNLNLHGTPVAAIDGLVIRVDAIDCDEFLVVNWADNVKLMHSSVIKPRSGSGYAVVATDTDRLTVRSCYFEGVENGLSLTNATNTRDIDNDWITSGTAYNDGGGNTGLVQRAP